MKLIKNYLYNVVFQLLQIILPLVTAPYISRVLGPNGVGKYTLSNSFASYFAILGVLGLTQYGNRMIAYYMDDRYERSIYFWHILVLRFLTVGIAASIYFLIVFTCDMNGLILYIIQSIVIFSTLMDVSWFFNGIENFKITVLRNILVKLVSVLLIFLTVKDNTDLPLYALIMVGGTFLGNITLWPFLRNFLNTPVFSLSRFKSIFFDSVVYFVPSLATSVYLVLNKLMIGWLDSDVAAVFFQQSDQIIRVVLSVVTAMNAVMLPRISNEFKKNNNTAIMKYIGKSVHLNLFISVPIMIGIIILGSVFAPWFFGRGFEPVGSIMAIEGIMIVFIGLNNVIGWQFMMPVGMVKQMSVAVVSGALINLFLNLTLIPIWGVIGATVATVVSEFVVLMVMVLYTLRLVNYKALFKESWRYVVSGVLMAVVMTSVKLFISNGTDFVFIGFVTGTVSYVVASVLFKVPFLQDLNIFIKSRYFRG
ncbi:flippase [Weissella confusa]|uniref:flippase n=1 Tax=Weissella confusa TaxID=1583 RepID=UPI00223AC663|nr:flippase [Weissella confusa]MCT0949321.1 flippase [Weissella confusa]